MIRTLATRKPLRMAMDIPKKMIFEVLKAIVPDDIGPRLGRISLPDRKDLTTPNFLAISSRGVVPHITPDVISQQTQIGGVHMALEDCKIIPIARSLVH